jgi:hypothetical protein
VGNLNSLKFEGKDNQSKIKLNIVIIYNLVVALFESINKNFGFLGIGLHNILFDYFISNSDLFFLDQESYFCMALTF